MPTFRLFLILLTSIIAIAFLVVFINGFGSNNAYKPGSWAEADVAVNQAKHFFAIRKASGEDFSSGPCLSNALMVDWIADIVHNPRMPIDDLPENQCPAFREGRASHFVELDIYGNVVRVQ